MGNNRGFFEGSLIKSAPPQRSLPQCGACKLFETCTSPKIPVLGAGARRVLFVGDAPGKEDDASGKLFTAGGGRYLRGVLRGLKFDLDKDGWQTNALICHTPKSRQPTPLEVGYCRANMLKTIQTFKPDVIVPLGVTAVSAVIGSIWKEDVGGIERWVGWQIPCQALNAWVCPTYHPDDVVRGDDEVVARQFKAHLKFAVNQEARPWPDNPPDWAADVVKECDPHKAAVWLRKCAGMAVGAVAWDIETNMLKPDGPDARIVSCSVAWGRKEPERCIAYPWHGEAIAATKELLCSPIPKIASNLKFEDRWARKEFGHRVRGWAWDTMLAAHVCDNRESITSVKFQAFVRLGVPLWNDKVEPFLKTKGNARINAIYKEINMNDLLLYNGLDSLLEFRVAVAQMKELGYSIPWEV